MKNILLLIPSLKNGGAEKVCKITAELLGRHNNLHIFLLERNTEMESLENVTLHRSKSIFGIFELIKKIKDNKIEYVYSFMERANFINVLISSFMNYEPILSIHTAPTQAFKRRKRVSAFISKFSYYIAGRRNIKVVAVSKGIQKELNESFGMKNTEVVYNPLDNRLKLKCSDSNLIKTNQKEKKIIIGYFGRFERIKGIEIILDSIARLNKFEIDKLEFIFLGNGSNKNKIELLANKIKNKIKIIDYTDDIFKYLKSVDVVLVPSFAEGFSLVTLESIFFKKFIIYSRCQYGPKELIEEVFKYKNAMAIEDPSIDLNKSVNELTNALELISNGKFNLYLNNDNNIEKILEQEFTEEIYLKRISNALFK